MFLILVPKNLPPDIYTERLIKKQLLISKNKQAAHVKHIDARNADYWRIASELESQAPQQFLAEEEKDTGGEALMNAMDHVIFCGDLNYRYVCFSSSVLLED